MLVVETAPFNTPYGDTMSFSITDTTAGAQRLAVDNSLNTEFGGATPSSSLSLAGRPLLSGANLAQNVAAPPSMPRITGSVVMPPGVSQAGIDCPAVAGFGVATISTGGASGIVSFNSTKTNFVVYGNPGPTSSATIDYAVF